jgi:ATP-binding cassette subfamily B (MDR/TAP) protein 1
MNITTVAFSLGLAFQYSWQMTLIMIAAFPLMALGSASQILLFKDQSDQEGIAKAGKTVTEAVGGIRTVASFTMETRLVELYQDLMKVPTEKKLKVAHAAGMGQAFGQASMFFVYAGVFYFGSLLVIAGSLTFDNMFKSMLLVLFAAFAMGQASTMAGDQGEARIAAKRLFRLIDQKSKIDGLSNAGTQLESRKIAGKIELVDVDFHYPERPDHAVFKKYNLTIEPFQTVALVGTSGGGKSTVISLIERFYDPINGSVLLDGVDIKSIDIGSLRDNIGLVSQEPTLFACSIADNIAFSYGGVGIVGQDAVVEAAKKANAHDFIMSFPEGYATFVGENGGTQLSGGQKQRIAIARAIIKDPPILLLDEATSALDSESERVVQETLDKLLKTKARTTVVIAHRLSTIKDADKIAVVYDGRIVEEGRFEELMQIEDGHFRRMAIRQESEES